MAEHRSETTAASGRTNPARRPSRPYNRVTLGPHSRTRLGVYEVTARIGEGGMGEVYRARDTKLNRDVALKVLPDSFADDPIGSRGSRAKRRPSPR